MLKKLKKIFGVKESETDIRKQITEKLNDKPFLYISEVFENEPERIVARHGHLNLLNEGKQFCATSGVETVFCLDIRSFSIWEFVSLNGCVITFEDPNTHKKRTFHVYYTD